MTVDERPDPASFPGGVSLTHVTVYDVPGTDGVAGGTPHLHTASAEAYLVLAGQGTVQTLGSQGYREDALAPGAVLWFTPGTVHRLVNGGGLELVVLMQNSGLPEAGDAVMTFPLEVLGDPQAYARAATLPDADAGTDVTAAVVRRRALALEGYDRWRADVG
ncbi:cupin domain-containing protein, partial [Cellulomonas bogoriensis]|uniref:cupin domain-containing protein n=1 Tax=Cellulomonas bogoriensis TaxID=301388 RepID=UPI0012EBDCC6